MFHDRDNGLVIYTPFSYGKVQQLRVSKCVAATYGCKQACLLCNQTLRETGRASFHVSVSASFFTDVNF